MASIWGFLMAILSLAAVHFEDSQGQEAKPLMVCRLLLYVLLATGPGVYYDGSNQALRPRYAQEGSDMLYDGFLVQLDEALVGFLWPFGQLALWLDQSPLIGPASFVGRCYTEVLQVMYTSYYLWGNAIGVFLCFDYFSRTLATRPPPRDAAGEARWRRLQMFTAAWTSAFLLNFAINMAVPAMSPRIYLEARFQHPIEGLFLANVLRAKLASAASATFSAFPSGHCGLSWLCPVLAFRLGFPRYAQVTLAAGLLITLATLVLRYHYFSDVVFASALLAFGLHFGGFWTQQGFHAAEAGATHADAPIGKGMQVFTIETELL